LLKYRRKRGREMEKTFETEVLSRLAVIESKLDDYKSIREKAETSYTISANNAKEIQAIKDNNKWLFRTTVGAVITSLIGILVAIFFKN
jgi:hypothetical protein